MCGKWQNFYFISDGKLYLYHILKRRYPVIKNSSSVLFFESTEMNFKTDANGLCVSISLKNMRWYLGVLGNFQKDECLIYIFIGKFQNGTPNIFNKNCINVGINN